jgi:hypothetical protein
MAEWITQLVRFLVVELTYPDLNFRFNMSIVFTANYFFSGSCVSVDSDVLLITDFVNLKIKPAQFFRVVHSDRVCICIFIGVSTHICMSIYVYTVFLKNCLCYMASVFDAGRGRASDSLLHLTHD